MKALGNFGESPSAAGFVNGSKVRKPAELGLKNEGARYLGVSRDIEIYSHSFA
jgi:hypothetical protein